jgi:hypothetical protein
MVEAFFGLEHDEESNAHVYDSIIDSFLIDTKKAIEIKLDEIKPGDLMKQLSDRIKARYLEDIIKIRVIDGTVHLMK